MLCRAPRVSSVRSNTRVSSTHANRVQRRNYATEDVKVIGGVRFENVTAKLTSQHQFLQYMTIPQQILFKVNTKFFDSLPESWHASQAAPYKKALDALETAVSKTDLKTKVADLLKQARQVTKDLTPARKLYCAIDDANVSGDVKARAQELLSVIEAWELGPQDSRTSKVNEAEKLLSLRKDKQVREGVAKALEQVALVADKWSPEEVKYVHDLHEKSEGALHEVWATEVRGVLQGKSAAEIQKAVNEKISSTKQQHNAQFAEFAKVDGAAFQERASYFLGPTLAAQVVQRVNAYKP